MVRFSVDEVNVFFPHDDLNGCDPHRFLSNESVWFELKRPCREADLSNLSNSEATYVCIYTYTPVIYTYLFNDIYYIFCSASGIRIYNRIFSKLICTFLQFQRAEKSDAD